MSESSGELILYTDPDGTTRLHVRLVDGTVWLSQALMASLFGKDVRTINEHLRNIYEEGELAPEATIRNFRIVQTEGSREVSREIAHYSLPAILAVGYRVRSAQGTRFRQWATRVLEEFAVKGFAMDDERLKNPGQLDYFDELLERIRAIRASERRFYQKITDIYAQCSVDYDPNAEITHTFYATVQNKLHFAVHGRTAAEIVVERAVLRLDPPSLEERNHAFHRMVLEGVAVKVRKDGRERGDLAWLFDHDDPDRNDCLVVSQLTVVGGSNKRRPDLVLYVNGLPLGVIEFKNPEDPNATIEGAHNQLQFYKVQTPFTITASLRQPCKDPS